MKIYYYNPETKEYIIEGESQENILNPDEPIIPAWSTTVKPPNKKDNYTIVWNGNNWDYKKDYRGQTWYNANTKQMEVINFIGDLPNYYYPPDSAIANPPEGEYWEYDSKTDTWVGNALLYKQYIYGNANDYWNLKLSTPYEFEGHSYLPEWRDLYTSIYFALNNGVKDSYRLQDANNNYLEVDKNTMKPIYVKMADIVDEMYEDKHNLENIFLVENDFDRLQESFNEWFNKVYK